jgi:hypothetical protein
VATLTPSVASMGSIGDSFGDAMAESFSATLKEELIYRRAWPTRHERKHPDELRDRATRMAVEARVRAERSSLAVVDRAGFFGRVWLACPFGDYVVSVGYGEVE